ncbi:MAG TPA: NAD+ synthase [Bacteroidia bacterium]|jgi:NAD+ synthase (glutamine-hydrolysing)|nr:NAD+ synthase [Bacteroidia bacterium]
MKIALAQLNYHIGNFESNTRKIVDAIMRAKKEGADLVVFSELCVCGYPPKDFLEFEDFISRCEHAVEEIANYCDGIAAIVGSPVKNPKVEGKNLFNAAIVLENKKIKSVHHKGLLPTYDVFDEYRYFEPAKEFHCAEIGGKKIALTVCEDLWDVEDDLMYTQWPMEELIKQKPDLMINIAASPFSYDHAEMRRKVLKRNVEKYKLPLFYLQHVGAQTELIFDGGSMVFNQNGDIVRELNYFHEDFAVVDSDQIQDSRFRIPERSKESLIHDALVLGIKDYFSKMGFTKAILGLSGGIDSALVLVLAIRALGKENVLPVLMPSEFSSQHSIDDSITLCKNLDCSYETIPIKGGYDEVLKMLSPVFKNSPFNVAEENIQARLRAITLMGIANKFGYILLNTTNKSEAAVGYGTLYGDMCGGISVIGDVYKTQVYELCRYINTEKEIIPENILTKAPSAELRPGQKDTDSLPDYSILDKILFEYIEKRQGPKELVKMGFEKTLVNRVLKMVNSNEWKRAQMAPVLRVSQKAFGSGRRMPIVGKYLG